MDNVPMVANVGDVADPFIITLVTTVGTDHYLIFTITPYIVSAYSDKENGLLSIP